MDGDEFLHLVPQFGNWGGNGANDAWTTGLALNATLQAFAQYNPGQTLLMPDPNNSNNWQTTENAVIIQDWIENGVSWKG